MSTTYRALARVFGTFDAIRAARKLFLEAEIASPAYSFAVKLLGTSGDETAGFLVCGELNRNPPAFAALDFRSAVFAQYPQLIIELLVERDDSQTHQVFQGGSLLYEASRQEATGDDFALGTPGLEYVYVTETGIRDAFLIAVSAAEGTHRLQPL